MSFKFSTQDIRDLYARYEAGESSVQIAQSLGCHSATLRNRFHKLGLPVRDMATNTGDRLRRLGPDERAALVRAAHDAVRGREQPVSEREQRAATHERQLPPMTASETKLALELQRRGVPFVRQKAAGVYNIDFAIDPAIAVECYGGHWHANGRHLARHEGRVKDLLDRGWHVVIVWIQKNYRERWIGGMDEVVALRDAASGDPSMIRQYRVIWGNGDLVVSRDANANDFPCKPAFEVFRDAGGRYYSVAR